MNSSLRDAKSNAGHQGLHDTSQVAGQDLPCDRGNGDGKHPPRHRKIGPAATSVMRKPLGEDADLVGTKLRNHDRLNGIGRKVLNNNRGIRT